MACTLYFLLAILTYSVKNTEQLFRSECVISSIGRWVVYDINKARNISIYNIVNSTIQFCDKKEKNGYRCREFEVENSNECYVKKYRIWCPVGLYYNSMMRLIVENDQNKSYISTVEQLPYSNCRCLWPQFNPINLIYEKSQRTLFFTSNKSSTSYSMQYNVFHRMVNDTVSDWSKVKCTESNEKYECVIDFKPCTHYNVCVITTIRSCHGNDMICKVYNASLQPYKKKFPLGFSCVLIDNEVRMSWSNSPIKNVHYEYVVYKDKYNQIFEGKTTRTTIWETVETSGLLFASVKTCTDCYCSDHINVSCTSMSTDKPALGIVEFVLLGCMPFLIVLFIFLIYRFCKRDSNGEIIHPTASDNVLEIKEFELDLSESPFDITPTNHKEYEEIEDNTNDDVEFTQLNLENHTENTA